MKLQQLKKLANKLGYGTTKSFSQVYKGGTFNAFGQSPECAVTIFTIYYNDEDLVQSIEVNHKYFEDSMQVKKLGRYISINKPKSIDYLLSKL